MKDATLCAISGLVGSTATITSLYMTTHKLNEMLDEEDYDPNHKSSQLIKAGILGIGAGAISGTIGLLTTDCIIIGLYPFVKK